jgi:hypothetical protein
MISSAETSGDIGVKLESESACESRPGTKAFYFLEPKCLNRHSLFCGVGSRVEMESDDAGSGFTGRLDKFPLLDVIQMACVAQRDGRLHIIHESDQGEVLLEKGQIFHAQTAQRNGEDALLEILCWRDGRFTFSPIIPRTLRKQSIAAHWQYALMDAVRKRDEKAHAGELSEEGKRAAATVLSRTLDPAILSEINRQRRRIVVKRGLIGGVVAALLFVSLTAIFWLFVQHQQALESSFQMTQNEILEKLSTRRDWQRVQPQESVIPAGRFVYQDGQLLETSAFAIDSTEVMIWQYAEFLRQSATEPHSITPISPGAKSIQTKIGRPMLARPFRWVSFVGFESIRIFQRLSSIGMTRMHMQNGKSEDFLLSVNGRKRRVAKKACATHGVISLSLVLRIFRMRKRVNRDGATSVASNAIVVPMVFWIWQETSLSGPSTKRGAQSSGEAIFETRTENSLEGSRIYRF